MSLYQHDEACEADWGTEGQESLIRERERRAAASTDEGN